MKKEQLYKNFSTILTHLGVNDENYPIKCNIIIREKEVQGLSSLELPCVKGVFQIPSKGIYFIIEGIKEPIEFNDLDREDLEIIYNNLL